MVLRQALGDRSVRFDARKLGWIGTPSVGLPSCAVMGFTGLKRLEDVINSKKPLKMGVHKGRGDYGRLAQDPEHYPGDQVRRDLGLQGDCYDPPGFAEEGSGRCLLWMGVYENHGQGHA